MPDYVTPTPERKQNVILEDIADGVPVSGVDANGVSWPLRADTAGELFVHAGGYGYINSATFTRPANITAYAVGDLVANNTTAGSVTPMQVTVARKNGGSGRIIRARLMKSGTVLTNASFRVHLYKTAPTPSNGDNGVWLTNNAANYLGAFDLTVDRAFTDGSLGTGVPLTGPVLTFVTGASVTVVYALIEARAAYTPISGEVFTLTLETDSD